MIYFVGSRYNTYYMIQPLVELYGSCVVVLKVSRCVFGGGFLTCRARDFVSSSSCVMYFSVFL